MQSPDDWRFPTNPQSRHPAAEITRLSVREERVAQDIEDWRRASHGRRVRRDRGTRWRSAMRAVLLALAFLGVVVAASAWLLGEVYSDRIYPSVVAGDVPVGSLTVDEATEKLEERVESYLEAPTVLKLEDRTWEPSAEDLGLSMDVDETVRRAFEARRNVPAVIDVAGALLGRARPTTVPFVASVDTRRLNRYLSDIARQVNREPVPPTLRTVGSAVTLVGGGPGYTVLQQETEARLLRSLASFSKAPVNLQVYTARGSVSAQAVAGAQAVAQKIVSGPILLEAEGRRWELPRARLVEWVRSESRRNAEGQESVDVFLDPIQLETYVRESPRRSTAPLGTRGSSGWADSSRWSARARAAGRWT